MPKEELLYQWKMLRAQYFNVLKEDLKVFEKKYGSHELFDSVVKHLDSSFRDINQIAETEINTYINKMS